MDWSNGYSATSYMTVVDPRTWVDKERINITGGTIQKSVSNLIESADINCINYYADREQIVRVWLDTRQGGEYNHTPLFTGYATSPSQNLKGPLTETSAQCYSVLKPADDVLLPHGWYAPILTDGKILIKRLLSVCNAPTSIVGDTLNLSEAIIAEENETNLTMAWKIADTLGLRLNIDGFGRIEIGPYESDSKWGFGVNINDVIEPNIKVDYDWYKCPNVFRASIGNYSAIARDEDENSIFSIPSRGREVWAEETNCDLADGEGLADYAKRQLQELQKVSRTLSYDRRFFPDVTIFDRVYIDYPEQNIQGTYMITSQTIELGYNARTSEEVIEV